MSRSSFVLTVERRCLFRWRTYFFGLSMSVALQFAEEGVLLGQQHFDVLHAHSDYPGANVGLQSVDALVGSRDRGKMSRAGPESSHSNGEMHTFKYV